MDNLTIVQHRRGTTADWEKYSTLVLREGEIGVQFCEDGSTLLKVGDGVTSYAQLKSITASDVNFDELYTYVDNQIIECNESIDAKVDAATSNLNLVDGLSYIENELQLTSNGLPVGNPIFIESGSGGGGGGSSSYIDYQLTLHSDTVLTRGLNSSCELDFEFTSVRVPQQRPTGNIRCEVYVGEVLKATISKPQGRNTIDVSPYLLIGENTVQLKCIDVYGNFEQVEVSINVIELRLTSTFNDALIYEGEVKFRYTPYPTMDKTIHFVLDREELPSDTVTLSGQEVTRTLSNLSHGSHILEVYSSAIVDEVDIESNHLKYEFISIEAENDQPIIASLFTKTTSQQGELISIPYIVYDPLKLNSDITLTITDEHGVEYSSQSLTVNRNKQYWNIRNYPIGEVTFTISYDTTRKVHTVSVTENDISVDAVTNELELYLSAAGRKNSESNPAVWRYNNIETTFDNFNWKSNGWCNDREDGQGADCLRISGDARVTVDFRPFITDLKLHGKTLEFEFAVRDVNNRDAVVIDCFDGSIGIQATADTAFLKSQGTTVSCNYKEEERIRVSFVVEGTDTGTRFISIYLDGVLSGVTQYTTDDNFKQFDPLQLSIGSEYCTVDIYSIRIYSTALTAKQILQNYTADISDLATRMDVYSANNIYDEYTGQISYAKLKDKVPTIVFLGKMPTFKGDKRKDSVRMIFEHPQQPELNFDEVLKQIDVQGTSSAGYVRKNWKTKHYTEHTHIVGEIPSDVFCIKVDYAEATGTHNTQNANFTETLYDQKILPQYTDERVRTTITGFPVVIFHLDTDDKNLIRNITVNELKTRKDVLFSSKGNFNFDKGSEDAFGFTDDYDVECWEFCNNTSDSVNFLGTIPDNYDSDFEARYHPQLGALEDLTDADVPDVEAIQALKASMITRFKVMHDWVVSTNKSQATGNELTTPYTDASGRQFTHDTAEYRIAKFRTEFNQYFDEHYTAVYYVYTFFALMVDQRAKNLFLTFWRDRDSSGNILESGKWYPYFYDNDTSFGINNEGAKVFDYYHEDIDTVGSANVYNGQNSTLWCNFREAFPSLIRDTYASMRQEKLTESKLVSQFVEQGSDMWSAAVYNEDAEYKYVSLARPSYDPDGDGKSNATNTYLYQVRGNGEQHLRYFIANRLKYCDSKWYAGNYFEDRIYLRIYTPQEASYTDDMTDAEKQQLDIENEITRKSIAAVPPCGDITVVPYSDVYAGVRYKAQSGDDITLNLQQQRARKNTRVVFDAPDERFNDTETYIYGASDLSSLGDLSPLYCGYIDVEKATKLTYLQIGNHATDYKNFNLHTLSVGANKLLKTIDITNCVGLTAPLDVSKCSSIENIYAKGSSITGVTLPDAGYVKVMHLPDTVNKLVIKNQLYLEDLSFDNYTGLVTLCIDNCPTLDATELLSRCINPETGLYTVQQVRLTGLDWSFDDISFLESLSVLRGLEEQNGVEVVTDHAYLTGTCHIKELTGEEMARLRSLYPHLTITFDKLTLSIEYKNEDGSQTVHSYTKLLTNGSTDAPIDIIDPVAEGLVDEIYTVKEDTAEYDYSYGGWSKVPNGTPDSKALTGIITNTVRYIAFNKAIRQYRVRFYNDTQLLSTQYIDYGKDAEYPDADKLTKLNSAAPYKFSHWEPAEKDIRQDVDCYAQFRIDAEELYTFRLTDFTYTLTGGSIKLTTYKNKTIDIGIVPATFTIDGTEYPVIVGGFRDTAVKYIVLSDGITEIADEAFCACKNLEYVSIPDSVTSIGISAFDECVALTEITLPPSLEVISAHMLDKCESLTSLIIPPKVHTIGILGLYDTKITSIVLPRSIANIGMYAFKWSSSGGRLTVEFEGTPTGNIHSQAFLGRTNVTFNVPWAENDGPTVGWGAVSPTINYEYRRNA